MNVTTWIILVIGLMIGVVDVWLLVRLGHEATISHQLLLASRNYPIVPFLFGVLMGHLFFPQCIK
jgi:hypothetical protein